MQKNVNKSEMVRDTANGKFTAAPKESSSFSSEEYQHNFRIKRRGVSPYGVILVTKGRLFQANVDARLNERTSMAVRGVSS